MVLGNTIDATLRRFRIQDYHLLWWAAPDPSANGQHSTRLQHQTPIVPHNLPAATRVGLTQRKFGLLPVRSPLLG